MAKFNPEFEAMLTASPDGRPQTINNTTLRDLFQNRSLDETKTMTKGKIESATRFFAAAGLLDMTPAEIVADPVMFTQAMQGKAYESLGKSQATKAQSFLSGIFEDAGHGASWPSRTLKTQIGKEAAFEAFDFKPTRATVKEFPDDVFSKLKESVVRLNATGDKEAAAQLLMHMFGGYRPEDLNGINIEDINFKTGVADDVEIKGSGGTTIKKAVFAPPILDAIRMHIGDRTTGLIFEDTQKNSKRINDVFDEVFGKDYLSVASPKGGKRQEPMRVKKLRNLNESILSGFDVGDQARKALTLRASGSVAEDYATSTARRKQLERITARNVALFSAGSGTTSVAQFMTDAGAAPSQRTGLITATKEVLEELGYENAVDPDFFNSLPDGGEVIGGRVAGQVDPDVAAAQAQEQKLKSERAAQLTEKEILQDQGDLEALREQAAKDKKFKKKEKKVATGKELIAKALKGAKPILKVVAPPVGYGITAIAADQTRSAVTQQAEALGLPSSVAGAAGAVAGATEFLPIAPSDVVAAGKSMASPVADPGSARPIERMMADQPELFTPTPTADAPPVPSLQPNTTNLPRIQITESEPFQRRQGMLSAEGAQDRVNQARGAALAGEETTLRGSFLN